MISANVKGIIRNKKYTIVAFLSLMFVIIMALAMSSESSAGVVFADMNEEMLKTKTVTVDQKLTLVSAESGSIKINSKTFLNLESNSSLSAKGSFSIDISNNTTPMLISGNMINVGNDNYINYNEMSSTSSELSSSLKATEAKLKGNWIKVRENDQFSTLTKTPLEFTSNVLPTPFANLNESQRDNVLTKLRSKFMYTLDESYRVEVAGVPAYKYSITYNKDQYIKVAKAISGYVSYFKADDGGDSDITALTVWVDIKTNRIIKIQFEGTSEQGAVTGVITFSKYNQEQTVQKPSDYSIESELLE